MMEGQSMKEGLQLSRQEETPSKKRHRNSAPNTYTQTNSRSRTEAGGATERRDELERAKNWKLNPMMR